MNITETVDRIMGLAGNYVTASVALAVGEAAGGSPNVNARCLDLRDNHKGILRSAIEELANQAAEAQEDAARYRAIAEGQERVMVTMRSLRETVDRLEATPPEAPESGALTDAKIIQIRDEHLPSQGEAFDFIAFARAIERVALPV